MKRLLGLFPVWALVLTGALHAQVLENISVGDSVRVIIQTDNAARRVEGIVLTLNDETVTIKESDGNRITFSVNAIYHISELAEKPDLYSLTPDHRIKVLAQQVQRKPLVGQFVEVDQQYLVLNDGKRQKSISIDQIDRLEVSLGTTTGRRSRGPFIAGVLVGGAVGGGLFYFLYSAEKPDGLCKRVDENAENLIDAGISCFLVSIFYATGLVTLGSAVGGLIGWRLAKNNVREVWEEIPVKASLTLLPVDFDRNLQRIGVTLTLKIGR